VQRLGEREVVDRRVEALSMTLDHLWELDFASNAVSPGRLLSAVRGSVLFRA